MANRSKRHTYINRPGLILISGGVLLLLIALSGTAIGYNQYSETKGSPTNCRACHGDFRSSSYTSLSDGTSWIVGIDSGLHDVHRYTMIGGSGKCENCHGGAGSSRFPVLLGLSAGIPETGNESCAGCHGREDDWTGNVSNLTEGWGAGLRQHHWNADDLHPSLNLKVCANCHTDADPANYTPAGENVKPKFYGLTYSGSDIPDDACNPGPGFEEDYTGGANLGLDNDGDGVYDQADSSCSASPTGAGENPSLTAQKSLTPGAITISWGAGCNATEHTIEYGDLANVASYAYAGQECDLTTPAGYDWFYPSSPQNLFFLIVADNGTAEGSYGLDSGNNERPDDDVNGDCPVNLDQSLADRCD